MSTKSAVTKSRQAFLILRSQILDGTIPAGTRLTLRPTARELGVGMNAVGEALRELEHEGLVEMEPRVGARVSKRDPAAVRSDFILRIALECEAVRHVATRAEPGTLRVLDRMADHADELARGDDLDATRKADMDFHRAVARFSEVPSLETALDPLLPRLVILDQVDTASPDQGPAHTQLVAALKESETAAAEAMREHILDAMFWGLGTGFCA